MTNIIGYDFILPLISTTDSFYVQLLAGRASSFQRYSTAPVPIFSVASTHSMGCSHSTIGVHPNNTKRIYVCQKRLKSSPRVPATEQTLLSTLGTGWSDLWFADPQRLSIDMQVIMVV